MASLKILLMLLLAVSLTSAHEGGELRFINGYIIEFHSGTIFEFDLLNETGASVDSVPRVQIYKNDVLVREAVASDISDEGYYSIHNNLSPGRYEIRPVFSVENRTISAKFSYENKGGIIDQILSFIISLFVKEKTTEVHEHADIAVYIDGKKLNLSQEKYMENSSRPMSELMHFHDMKGNIVHKHAVGVTLGHFFGTIDMKFNSSCFAGYCNVRMYVNGKENFDLDKYEFHDLDRILITAGNYSSEEINEMINSVTNDACIQSGKCPERGKPFDESNCTTEGGCS